MPDQGVLEEMVRRISELETRLKRMELEKQKFEILNNARVVLNTDQTAWNIPAVDHIMLEPTVNVNIHGIANGVDGRVLFVHNQAGFTVTLKWLSGSALLRNRIAFGNGSDVVLLAGDVAMLSYCYFVGQAEYLWRGFFLSP